MLVTKKLIVFGLVPPPPLRPPSAAMDSFINYMGKAFAFKLHMFGMCAREFYFAIMLVTLVEGRDDTKAVKIFILPW